MREFTTTRRVGYGIVLGVLTGIVVVALTYIVDKVTGVGFPPFSLFDFMTRVLPGAVVTATIDLMVGVISRLNVGSTASAAKLAEQSFAILQFIVLGGVMGAVLGLFRNIRRLPTYGLGIGLVLVAAFAAIQAYLGFPAVGATASIGWIVLVFGFWGMALGWTLRGMLAVPADEAAAGGLSRRQAIYLGGTALAAVAAALVGLGFLLRGSQQAQQASATPIPAGGPTASPTETALAGRIEPAPGTRPEITSNDDFYRIDINTRPPSIAEDDWTLEIGGLVDNPSTLTLADIRARPTQSQYVTLSCISNRIGGDLISTALWTGTRFKDLLADFGLQPDAKAIAIEAEDGFYETVVMEDMMDERTLLVYEMNGQPLPQEHGFPLRIYIPNRYGMKQPKWIVRMMAVADEPNGYWVDRGWSRTAEMRTTSVIDAVNVEQADDGSTVMGGIAHAGERGISKVEVQVDDGPWQEAELRVPPLSQLTWVQWRYQESLPAGGHVAAVRAYDGDGTLQVAESNPPHPNGATGIDTFSFEV